MRLDPAEPACYLKLGRTLVSLQQERPAAVALDKALQHDPQNAETRGEL